MDRKPDGALGQLSRAGRASRTNPAVLTNTAATLYVLRRNAEAITLMRQILSQSPPPEIEVEVLAMLRLADPSAAEEVMRLRDLIGRGHRGDGNTLRVMVRNRPRTEWEVGIQLADIVEGKAALPPTL
jgi:hypothetical protein